MNPIRILLIGDEPNLLRTLRRNLIGRGYEVSIALDDAETLEISAQVKPDLFVLNLDFSSIQVNGLDICTQLRKVSQSPLIVLSSIESDNMKIQALDQGADDYLVMPFSMEEFLARVRSSLRRWTAYRGEKGELEQIILRGELIIQVDSHQLTVHGKSVRLTPKEYEVLLYLAQRNGKVVTHRELLRSIWGVEYGDEREYLRVLISQLRHKIEDNPLRPKYLLTEPGIGYRFASDSN
ncbi:MAG TPA: response regulator transcription factor [Anaerolineaceae bacterium]|jgi:two-component system KDP operon response regulator KdpE